MKEKGSKEYHRNRDYSIGCLDDKNFYVAKIGVKGEESKSAGEEEFRDTHFFATIEGALEYYARQAAKREAVDIQTYISEFKQITDEIKGLLS